MAKVHLIGNAHLDPVWLWRWQEGYSEVLATFRSALDRMNEFEDYVFTCAGAAYYQWVEETDPAMFEEIKHRVQEGRWVIVGGWWIQPDCNAPSGESFARHALYSQRYYMKKFGKKAEIGYNVDSFGHNAMLPQLLKESGLRGYVFMRPNPHEEKTYPFPYTSFIWESIDTLPEIVGLALHKDGHVGYYVGNGYAVEWRGFSHGCVKTKVSGRDWKYWYKLTFIDYGDGTEVAVPPAMDYVLGSRLLRKGMTGADVRAMQELLMQLGYELPGHGADGDFGSETLKALLRFQRAEELEADGLYGSLTHSALMDAVADDDEGRKDEPMQEPAPEEPAVPEEPKPVRTTVVIVSEGGKVNIRTGNGTGYTRITSVAPGTVFEYVATAVNGWHAVIVNGQVGWVSGSYAELKITICAC